MLKRLSSFRSNVHSQNGEDGIIAELIRRLGLVVDQDFWCVEFGAWDGVHLSNVFALVESNSATAVMIEGDKEKFGKLKATAENHPSVIPVEGFVTGSRVPEFPVTDRFTGTFGHDKMSTLDRLLSTTRCPENYDLLSIDIDSYDLEAWEAHRDFRPKIVVIEINTLIEPGILQWHGVGGRNGNSFSSTLAVAKAKGYTLVCCTGNMFFVQDELAHLVELDELDSNFPERLFNDRPRKTHLSKNRALQRLQKILQAVFNRLLGL